MIIKNLVQTCDACPSHWEGITEDGKAVYIRHRWGILSYGIGKDLDEAVLNDGRDVCLQIGQHGWEGIMTTEEMLKHLGWETE